MTAISALVDGDPANLLRTLVLVAGGIVVGLGCNVLHDRARFYTRADIAGAASTMYLLAAVNALVMAYIAATLLSRWDDELSWRFFLAIAIFVMKALFFRGLRAIGLEQERRALFGS